MSYENSANEASTLNCSECSKALGIAVGSPHSGLPPVMLWGGVGVGKSSVVRQAADAGGIPLIDLRLALLNPVDLRGLPVPDRDAGLAGWLPPSFLPDEGRDGSEGVLFLDEINAAPPAVQAAAYQLVLDRRVGDYELPEGWRIVAAGNRMTDRGVTHRMPAPLANRLLHLHIEPTLDNWKNWALGEGDIAAEVLGFLNFSPGRLTASPDGGGGQAQSSSAFPSPRSWAYLSSMMEVIRGRPVSSPLREIAAASAVGEGAAREFNAFLRVSAHLPDPADILAGSADLPGEESIDVLYALCGSVVVYFKRAVERTVEERSGGEESEGYPEREAPSYPPEVEGFFEAFASRLPQEFSVLAVRDALRAGTGMGAAVTSIPGWEAWYEKHGKEMGWLKD